jgi:hypothetical protein
LKLTVSENKDNPDDHDEADSERANRESRDEQVERKIDLNLEGSFPASDPPAWTLGIDWRE